MRLFNTQTRELDPIDDQDALQQALLSGSHSFEAGTRVEARSPDGVLGTIPSENAAEAVRAGYKIETPSQKAVRQYVDDNKGLGGAVKVAAGQMADEALMGLPELIADKTQDPLEVAKREALKNEHDLANTLGGLTGFGASLFVGGPLWKAGAKAGEKVTAHVAEKLAVQAGEEVGSRTLKKAAQEIVANMTAKGAGAAVEGGVVSLPHAVTEASLGDPDDAAETLLAGVGVGALLGSGGALAKDLAKLGKDAALKGAGFITQQDETAKSLARKAAKVLTGVPENDILHYLENADRVNAAPSTDDLKFMLDDAVGKRVAARDAAKENLSVAQRELDDGYRVALMDLQKEQAPEVYAKQLVTTLDEAKVKLGEMSEIADDLLEESGKTFQKKDLLRILDDVGGSIGVPTGTGKAKVLISDEAMGAVQKLKAQRDRVAMLPDEIDARSLRAVLREVRKDIKWNQLAGEFNDTLNKARKTFTETVSDTLKTQVPKYGQQMEKMAKLSGSLESMVKLAGDEGRALRTLNGIATPKGAQAEAMMREFGDAMGMDLVAPLQGFKSSKQLRETAKRQDIRHILLPEQSQKVARIQEELARADAAYEPVRRLSQERTQTIIRNQGFKNASIEDRKALEALGVAENQDFLTLIKDRNVLDAFSKDFTNGSRRTLLGTILGAAAGGPLGAPIGAVAGATIDTHGGAILKKLLDANRNVSGLLFSEKAMKQAAEKLDEIPDMLGRMAKRAAPKSVRPGSTSALTRLLLGSAAPDAPAAGEAKGESPRLKKLEEFNSKASGWVSNPQAAAAKIAALTEPLIQGGAPGIGAAFGRKASVAMNYLYQEMPKPPRPRSPFAPKVAYVPPSYELAAFEDKVQIATDPFSALTELEHGTLTRAHVDALKAVYPGLLRMIQLKVQNAVVTGVEPMAYSQRAKLSMLLDVPMDTSLTPQAITYYQEAYVASEEAAAQSAQGEGFKATVNFADQVMSQADRITSGV